MYQSLGGFLLELKIATECKLYAGIQIKLRIEERLKSHNERQPWLLSSMNDMMRKDCFCAVSKNPCIQCQHACDYPTDLTVMLQKLCWKSFVTALQFTAASINKRKVQSHYDLVQFNLWYRKRCRVIHYLASVFLQHA